ncbi:M61 family metallopeptidase [Winogradskyella sediminis]|uniref:Predicted metalloprotease, contains C-terminal PDZ domain n=1 Tax=Winogradskyella sediminis TaxID=1382466 RepID=A0A1H1SZ62_9FLAO|nr:PDZ domain-containing protein [Winogradskyella sediminis]SDS53194.1 Predicted metalloprotease, contains C-terminal PDZ domain [Winogradskyella sediminis]
MRSLILLLSFLCLVNCKDDKTSETELTTIESSSYIISFENAAHHEAEITATFKGLKSGEATFRMSRSSPGRYAIHEFAKNVYNVKVTDEKGNVLETTRPDPYSWNVNNHDGTIIVNYTLYANHGDGTYAQIDETHAHLNMPATFMYAPSLENDTFNIEFKPREDLNWKIATQLKLVEGNKYSAENLQYFMDSPTEISDHMVRSFEVDGQKINFALHHNGTAAEFDDYFENVKKTILQQKAVFGELPTFDYGEYTFLGCYIPNATGDGMEHRNSTIVTSTRSLADGAVRNLGTVSHEFFHCWNVERIRPQSLEPFNFEAANMSGELWFAEGFTSYYDDLTLTRAGIIAQEDYIKGLTGTFNYVWNSPGRQFFNPIEMSYQAPFVDAARSVDDINRDNTFISYYSYGSMLGLALDLSLRTQNLNLDDYMTLVWNTYGKTETYYTIADLQQTLKDYAGAEFGDDFFNNYIYKSGMPDFETLFKTVGVQLQQNTAQPAFGLRLNNQVITSNTLVGSGAYTAGLEKGDKLLKIDGVALNGTSDLNKILGTVKPHQTVDVVYERFGKQHTVKLTLDADMSYTISSFDELSEGEKANREAWLGAK